MIPPKNPVSVSIIHHHLDPGGVTQVVELGVKALSAHLPDLDEVRLVAGRSGGAEALAERLKEECSRLGVSVSLTIIGEIDYLPINSDKTRNADVAVAAIKRQLLRSCTGSVWMVHNYHLGKNPLFTRALLEIAEEEPYERICFYIHDFPESSRYENLSFLQELVPDSPYPTGPNVRYLVINSRDLKYLTGAGIPESAVFLLNNPVPEENLPVGDTALMRPKLEKCIGNEFPAYNPEAPLGVYPVRTIRRKNVLEMGMICAVSPEPVNLVVTLPGTSQTEKKYSEYVSEAFSEGLIPGIWGAGLRLDEAGITFPQFLSMADLICSSSVQEGFGYLFINAVAWGKPLFARHLDVLDGIIGLFDGHPSHFYTSIRVPASPGKTEGIRASYEQKARRMAVLAGSEIADSVMKDVADVINDRSFEFSYLPIDEQIAVLRRVKSDAPYREAVFDLNKDAMNALGKLCTTKQKPNATTQMDRADQRDWPFTYQNYAATVQTIIDSFASNPPTAPPPDVQSALIRQFATIDYSRLLYGN